MESQQPNVKSSPRDVFMYIFATIALYFSTWSVIQLLIGYIDVAFPDPLNPYYEPGGSIRWSMALLIIIFPAYFWVSRFLHRDLLANPEKGEIRIRKWLIYLTLFLAALLLIGDLVALIYRFLEGDLTIPFFLKVLAVLAVGAAVFWYYLYDLRARATPLAPNALLFVRAAVIVIVMVIVSGFFIAGSPFRQRLARFDNQKTMDLQNIQWELVNYWRQKNQLPQTLDELRDDIRSYVPPVDPQSGKPYEYRATGELSFELCAEFNLASSGQNSYTKPRPIDGAGVSEVWDHPAGRHCFSRTIDPELYAPIPPGKPAPTPIVR